MNTKLSASIKDSYQNRWTFRVGVLRGILNPCIILLCLLGALLFLKVDSYDGGCCSFKVNYILLNTPLWVFFTFFKLFKWYQIAQRTTYTTAFSIILSSPMYHFEWSLNFIWYLHLSRHLLVQSQQCKQ